MSFQDKAIVCSDCGVTFTFSVQDQEFFQSKGYTNEPRRCPACRQTRKAQTGGGNSSYGNGGYGGTRQMYPATCSDCGKATQVPFEPRNGKPVYCSDCYRKIQAR